MALGRTKSKQEGEKRTKVQKDETDQIKEEICDGAPGTKCDRAVKDMERGIECDICHKWFHASCQGVNEEAYEALQQHLDTLAWICKVCRGKMEEGKDNLDKSSASIEGKIEKLADIVKQQMSTEGKIEELAGMVKEQMRVIRKSSDEQDKTIRELGELQARKFITLSERVNELSEQVKENKTTSDQMAGKSYAEAAKTTCERIISTLGPKLDALPKADRLKDMELKVVEKMKEQQEVIKNSSKDIKRVMESREKEDRASNILIHNIPESESEDYEKRKEEDIQKFMEIAEALGATDIELHKLVRLRRKMEEKEADGQKGKQRPKIMLLKLGSSEQADMIFRRRFNLKSKGFVNTYITRDLPPKEREEQRKLRAELQEKGKATHVIFRGKVVERRV